MPIRKVSSRVPYCRGKNLSTADGLAEDPPDAPTPVSVTEYIAGRRVFFYDERFRAIPCRPSIRAQTPIGQVALRRNQEKAWPASSRQNPCRQVSWSGWDVKYVQCKGEINYLRRLCFVYDAHGYRMDIEPSVNLVAFKQPFYRMYWISIRVGWSEDAPQESRLRCCVNDQYFYMWHCTRFFLVLTCERPRLYQTLPTSWVDVEAPEDLCVPTPTIIAYTGRRWMAISHSTVALV